MAGTGHSAAAPNADSSLAERSRRRCQALAQLTLRYPHVVLIPLALLGLMLGLGLWGVQALQEQSLAEARQAAEFEARSTAQALVADLNQVTVSLIQVSKFAQMHPDAPTFLSAWDLVIEAFWSGAPPGTGSLATTILGVLRRIYGGAGNVDLGSDLGVNYLSPSNPYRDLFLRGYAHQDLYLTGPFMSPEYRIQIMTIGKVVRIPNVAANETWRAGEDYSYCPAGLCYNPATRTKIWGTVSMNMACDVWFNQSAAIRVLLDKGYNMLLSRAGVAEAGEPPLVVVHSPRGANTIPSWAVRVPLIAITEQWQLDVWAEEPRRVGPAFEYIVVVVASIVIAALLFTVLLAWVENHAILHSLLPKHTIARIRQEAEWTQTEDQELHSIQMDTPASHMLKVITNCLEQVWPSVQVLLSIRDALQRTADVYRPTAADFRDRLQASDAVDAEVRQALVAQLIGDTSESGTEAAGLSTPVIKQGSKSLEATVPFANSGATLPAFDESESDGVDQQVECADDVLERMSKLPTGSCKQLRLGLTVVLRQPGAWQGTADWPASRECSLIRATRDSRSHARASAVASQGLSRVSPQSTSDCSPPMSSSEGAKWLSGADYIQTNVPDKPLWTQLEVILGGVDTWAFDSFALEEASCGHPLSVLGYYLISQTGLAHWANMNVAKLIRFLQAVEDGYPVTNPYHNKRHAAEVLQAMHMIVTQGGLTPGFVDEGAQLACYLSAIIHDFEHRGRNNDYLVNAHDELAVRYNDKSPMENHHLAAAWGLLRKPELNCLSDVPKATWLKLRKLMIDLVLATDMKQHFAILGQFETMHQVNTNTADKPSPPPPPQPPPPPPPRSSANGSHVKQSSLSGTQPTVQTPTQLPHIVPISDNDRTLSLQMALKCADLANLAAPLHVYLRWVRCLEEELFQQGDDERAQGLALSPLCDRTKAGVSKSQSGFFTFVACPLFKAYTSRFTDAMPMMQSLLSNLKYWNITGALASRSSTEEGDKRTSRPSGSS